MCRCCNGYDASCQRLAAIGYILFFGALTCLGFKRVGGTIAAF